ncbi:MAG TPA: hypothetical protein VJG48_03725 [Candidatus Paceibacterota bacterium]
MAASKKKLKKVKVKVRVKAKAKSKKIASKKRVVKKVVKRKVLKKRIVKKKVAKKSLKPKYPKVLNKHKSNPIMRPVPGSYWESAGVFNPGAVVQAGRVHLFYRALGGDGVSRVGYASSKDGIRFDKRLTYPIFAAETREEAMTHWPNTSPARLVYDTVAYASGGGWGGCEDPRAVKIEGRVYLTFTKFDGWESMRVAFTSIGETDLERGNWAWSKYAYLSPPGDRQKNWVLFPDKFNGKFAILHNIDMGDASRVHIAYVDKLDMRLTPNQKQAPNVHNLPNHNVAWHNRTRSASAPPIKTKDGWLLLYHAMDKRDPGRYKVGAMLLDLEDPTKVIYRSAYPILEPDEWYENDWKPGIVFASGAVVKDGELFIYYGGGDKYVAVAHTKLDTFLDKLMKNEHIVLKSEKALKV